MAKLPKASASSHSPKVQTDSSSGLSREVSLDEVKRAARKKKKSNYSKKRRLEKANIAAMEAEAAKQSVVESPHARAEPDGPLIVDGNIPRSHVHDAQHHGDTSDQVAGALILQALSTCQEPPAEGHVTPSYLHHADENEYVDPQEQQEDCQPTVFEKNGIVFGHQAGSSPPLHPPEGWPYHYPHQNHQNTPQNAYSAPSGWYTSSNAAPYPPDAQASPHCYNLYPAQCPPPSANHQPDLPTGAQMYSENDTVQAVYGGSGNNPRAAEELVTPSADTYPSNPECASLSRTISLGSPMDEHREIEPVSFHLLRVFRTGDFADCQLALQSSSGRFYTLTYPLHRLVVGRSNHLVYLLGKVGKGESLPQIKAVAGRAFIQPKALGMALQNLYGLTLITQRQLDGQAFAYAVHGHGPLDNVSFASSSIARMDFALCYATSGAFLADNEIMTRGLQLAAAGIQWETVEKVLLFGLRPSEFMMACINEELSDEPPSSASSDNGSDSGWNPASDRRHIHSEKLYLSAYCLNREIANTWASKLLRMGLEFIANNISLAFELDEDAQSSTLPSRFAGTFTLTDASIPPVKFGEFSGYSACSRETTIASSVFLSLPFKTLKKLLELMKNAGVASLHFVEDVIAERERRRFRALRNVQLRGLLRDGTNSKFECLGWEESIKPRRSNSDNDFTISKVWRGLDADTLLFGKKSTRGTSSV